MRKSKALCLLASMAGGFISMGWAANSAANHPGYVQALSDLRAAQWMLTHQTGDAKVYDDEKVALNETNAAIGEIKNASIDDGKSSSDRGNVDVTEHGSRLLRALETLHKAQADIRGEGDKPDVKDLRIQANHHIDLAIQAADRAHTAWLKDNKK